MSDGLLCRQQGKSPRLVDSPANESSRSRPHQGSCRKIRLQTILSFSAADRATMRDFRNSATSPEPNPYGANFSTCVGGAHLRALATSVWRRRCDTPMGCRGKEGPRGVSKLARRGVRWRVRSTEYGVRLSGSKVEGGAAGSVLPVPRAARPAVGHRSASSHATAAFGLPAAVALDGKALRTRHRPPPSVASQARLTKMAASLRNRLFHGWISAPPQNPLLVVASTSNTRCQQKNSQENY